MGAPNLLLALGPKANVLRGGRSEFISMVMTSSNRDHMPWSLCCYLVCPVLYTLYVLWICICGVCHTGFR